MKWLLLIIGRGPMVLKTKGINWPAESLEEWTPDHRVPDSVDSWYGESEYERRYR
jgi:hypothetical protein